MKGMVRELFHFSGLRDHQWLIASGVRLVGFGPNWWLGVSAGFQAAFDTRWPALLAIPTNVRWLSYEPALDPVVLPDDVEWPAWVVCGCQSRGSRAGRPLDLAWARSMRDQCRARGIPFFMKQTAVNGR